MHQLLVVVVPPSQSESTAEVIAALDLGSNSFHLIVAELRHGQLVVLDRLKETRQEVKIHFKTIFKSIHH